MGPATHHPSKKLHPRGLKQRRTLPGHPNLYSFPSVISSSPILSHPRSAATSRCSGPPQTIRCTGPSISSPPRERGERPVSAVIAPSLTLTPQASPFPATCPDPCLVAPCLSCLSPVAGRRSPRSHAARSTQRPRLDHTLLYCHHPRGRKVTRGLVGSSHQSPTQPRQSIPRTRFDPGAGKLARDPHR